MKPPDSFLWHDYETFGANPATDRPAQFAAIRTNADLDTLGEPVSWFCKPSDDFLPHPGACLVTGITPQDALQHGLCEAEFAARIHAEMMEPGTCVAGYNNLRFDDEVSRNLFYRNFYDPYEREYRNGNSRWDIIDLARMCYALRPQGIQWPVHDNGSPSFKLEHLTAANDISHKGAHDALADVRATIDLARLIKQKQPALYQHALSLRDQKKVQRMLNTVEPVPVLHTSAKIPATRGCTTLVLPLCVQPERAKSVIVFDLMTDPGPLLELDAEEIRDRVFTPAADLPEGVERLALKAIHTNKVPMVAIGARLDGVDTHRLQLDPERCIAHAEIIQGAIDKIRYKVMDVFTREYDNAERDPDLCIYSGGFFSGADRKLMTTLRSTKPASLATRNWPFRDRRLAEMLFRYRARNWPETLDQQDTDRWQKDRLSRLTQPPDERQLSFETFTECLSQYRQQHVDDPKALGILDRLEAWSNELRPAGH
jgi:exodeoxyribonuclease-1